MRENNQRVEEQGLEEDPVRDRIYELLPKRVGVRKQKHPSKTDTLLLATALAAGFLNGQDKVVLTNDKPIASSLILFSTLLLNTPRKLYLDDIDDFLNGFFMRVCRIWTDTYGFELKQRAAFNGEKYLHLRRGAMRGNPY